MIFVCSATHKTKSMFFFLAQTEQGDIFKVTLETDEEMVSKAEWSIRSVLQRNINRTQIHLHEGAAYLEYNSALMWNGG